MKAIPLYDKKSAYLNIKNKKLNTSIAHTLCNSFQHCGKWLYLYYKFMKKNPKIKHSIVSIKTWTFSPEHWKMARDPRDPLFFLLASLIF